MDSEKCEHEGVVTRGATEDKAEDDNSWSPTFFSTLIVWSKYGPTTAETFLCPLL